ncbi:restriction endonuclease subunit S [Acetobacter pasteurianus]|uniref:restriction endonuclease subunit S n=1 Tax=Acetobacter pasteurianus TaxID=438 RepID=UPI000F58808D|nr:restriction endonuclease subunit S [Acetobacter pasteurianus]GCD57204.1 restriction endonuclease subunit S [Acetobacter pasteurianus NBRC 3222]
MLPEGWKEERLGDLCEKISDGIHTTPNYDENSDVFFVNGNNIQTDGLNFFENTKKVSQRDYEKYKKDIGSNTILMSINGTIGNTCLYNNERVVLGKSACYLNIKKSIDLIFILHSLRSSHLQNYFLSELTGTTIRNLSLKTIKSSNILLPPLPEQKKIAAILSTWDRAIEGTEKLLANSQQQKKALMQQLLTGKKRLPGFTGEWKSLKLKTFLQESIIPSPQPDPKKRITVRLSLNGVEKREVRGTESIDATNYFTRKAGQFIYGKQNIHKGAFGIIPKILDGFETSQDIPCFDFLPNACSAWLFYYLARENIHNTLETKMTGTGSKRLNQKTFLNLTCLAPPLSEQKAIAAVLTTADEEITALESDLARLRQEKKALMQQLLTGKRRVTVD